MGLSVRQKTPVDKSSKTKALLAGAVPILA